MVDVCWCAAGKCIASQSKSTFFSISASSLTSKWVRLSVTLSARNYYSLIAVALVHVYRKLVCYEDTSLPLSRILPYEAGLSCCPSTKFFQFEWNLVCRQISISSYVWRCAYITHSKDVECYKVSLIKSNLSPLPFTVWARKWLLMLKQQNSGWLHFLT